jgi:hypothetical protein
MKNFCCPDNRIFVREYLLLACHYSAHQRVTHSLSIGEADGRRLAAPSCYASTLLANEFLREKIFRE